MWFTSSRYTKNVKLRTKILSNFGMSYYLRIIMYDNILMNERRMKGAKFRRLYLILYFESHEYIAKIYGQKENPKRANHLSERTWTWSSQKNSDYPYPTFEISWPWQRFPPFLALGCLPKGPFLRVVPVSARSCVRRSPYFRLAHRHIKNLLWQSPTVGRMPRIHDDAICTIFHAR